MSENVPLNFLRAHPDCLFVPRFANGQLSWSVFARNSEVQYGSLEGICFYHIYPLFLNRRRYRGATIVRFRPCVSTRLMVKLSGCSHHRCSVELYCLTAIFKKFTAGFCTLIQFLHPRRNHWWPLKNMIIVTNYLVSVKRKILYHCSL